MAPRLSLAVIALFALAASARAGETAYVDSAYTPLDFAACEDFAGDFGVDARCDGYGGVPLYVSRTPGKPWVEYGASDGLATAFENTATPGDLIEWTLDADGAPFAAILRYKADALEGTYNAADVLVVHRILDGGTRSCWLAAIDASTTEQANGFARGVAAASRWQDGCGSGPVIAVGGADSPVHHILSFE